MSLLQWSIKVCWLICKENSTKSFFISFSISTHSNLSCILLFSPLCNQFPAHIFPLDLSTLVALSHIIESAIEYLKEDHLQHRFYTLALNFHYHIQSWQQDQYLPTWQYAIFTEQRQGIDNETHKHLWSSPIDRRQCCGDAFIKDTHHHASVVSAEQSIDNLSIAQ